MNYLYVLCTHLTLNFIACTARLSQILLQQIWKQHTDHWRVALGRKYTIFSIHFIAASNKLALFFYPGCPGCCSSLRCVHSDASSFRAAAHRPVSPVQRNSCWRDPALSSYSDTPKDQSYPHQHYSLQNNATGCQRTFKM